MTDRPHRPTQDALAGMPQQPTQESLGRRSTPPVPTSTDSHSASPAPGSGSSANPIPPPTRTEQVPSVGRAVHYVAYGTPGGEYPSGICRAATITEVSTDGVGAVLRVVGLCIMNPTGLFFTRDGLFFTRDVPYDPDKRPGTWHWPEYVAPQSIG